MWIQILFRPKYTLLVTILTLFSTLLHGQENGSSVKLLFNQGKDVILKTEQLNELDSLIGAITHDSLTSISRIEIVGYGSPEGSIERNEELAMLRAEAAKSYITNSKVIPDSLITATSGGVAWSELEQIIERERLPYADAVRQIISDTSPPNRDSRLQAMDRGIPYREMYKYIFPELRSAEVTIYYNRAEEITIEEFVTEVFTPLTPSEPTIETKPLFAIKTNLLFDLLTLINVEIEIPIRRRWSITGEFIFPWWVMDNHEADSKRNRLQLLNGNLEGRYWFGERESRPILTGWFAGLYAGGGSFDFEHHAKGYQGEFFIASGLSGGYAHTINRAETLRLEYSIGVGYLATDYRYYEAEYCYNEVWHAVKKRDGRYHWFGPTKAKVSLSWLINYNAKKR